MFERYSENARRVLFFARYEAALAGLLSIEPEHLRVKAGDKDNEPGAQTTGSMVAFGPRGGAVVRQWKGVVKPGKALQYVAHLRTHTIAALAELEGFVSYSVMRRDVEDGVEFQVLTIWRSLDAIRAFAGEDVTRAVVPPAAQALMVRYDDHAVHYDIVQ
jgi:heme-degrading monooxygenase HmoA